MIRPAVDPRIEEAHKLTLLWILGRQQGTNITALIAIAKGTGMGQVVNRGCAPMFFTDNVVDLATPVGIISVDQAVFAEMAGA
jgi:hypothetical protein